MNSLNSHGPMAMFMDSFHEPHRMMAAKCNNSEVHARTAGTHLCSMRQEGLSMLALTIQDENHLK